MRGEMVSDWLTIFERIKRKPEAEWRGEIEKIEKGYSFQGSKQTIKEKVTIELVLEHKRRRAWGAIK